MIAAQFTRRTFCVGLSLGFCLKEERLSFIDSSHWLYNRDSLEEAGRE